MRPVDGFDEFSVEVRSLFSTHREWWRLAVSRLPKFQFGHVRRISERKVYTKDHVHGGRENMAFVSYL